MALRNRTHETVLEWNMSEDGWSHWLSGLGGRTPDDVLKAGLRAVIDDTELGKAIRKDVRYRTVERPDRGGAPEAPRSCPELTHKIEVAVPTALLGKAMAVFRAHNRRPDLNEFVASIIINDDSWMNEEDDPEHWGRGVVQESDLERGLSSVATTHASSEISLKTNELAIAAIIAGGTAILAIDAIVPDFLNLISYVLRLW